jgi:hypothetical protein
MRFFTRMVERETHDAQEKAAMLYHRLDSIRYQLPLYQSGALAYAFRVVSGNAAVLMYDVATLQLLDLHLKRDPGWPYAHTEVVPVVSTEDLVREAQDYLGEHLFTDEELPSLCFERRRIDSKAMYWLAYKEVRPFSPLLTEESQNDVHRRTILAQRAHFESLEFADDNPVGKAVGILVAESELEAVKAHVESCDVFPDTTVQYTELLPLERAWDMTVAELSRMRRSVPSDHPFASVETHTA